jgi:shikimate dehydrogenase
MKRYGLIGGSLKHSFSQQYFTAKFAAEHIDAQYDLFELKRIEDFSELCKTHPDLHGLNVTFPYKKAIIPYLDSCDAAAKTIGAVNVIHFKDGQTIGYNTDHIAFSSSLGPFLAHGMERALILGTGGAAHAAAYALRKFGIEVRFVSRKPTREDQLGYDQINEHVMRAFRIIVNATPLGTYPNLDEKPPLPYAQVSPEHLLYDMVYNPAETAFIKEGKKQGAITTNGLTMLHLQAERSWEIWQNAGE